MRGVALITTLALITHLAVGADTNRLVIHEIDSPAGAGSSMVNLTTAENAVHMSWIETQTRDGGHRLLMATRTSGRWSAPVEISRGKKWFVNWADFPSMAVLGDGTYVAHWLEKSGVGTYSYDVRVSLSRTRGTTWSPPITPHRDGIQAEHGFVSMVPVGPDRATLIWLDGRNMPDNAEDTSSASRRMTLRAATLTSSGRLVDEVLLDDRVCECCQTDAVALDDGTVAVVYRDRSETEVRDISVVRLKQGKGSSPQTVHRDNWQFFGCPVNGPAIDAMGNNVAVAWWTATADTAKVCVAFSQDGAISFDSPVVVSEERKDAVTPIGRVDVRFLRPDVAAVSSVNVSGDDGQVVVSTVKSGGTASAPLVVTQTSSARSSGFPRITRSGDGLLLGWTDVTDQPRVRLALLEPQEKASRQPDGAKEFRSCSGCHARPDPSIRGDSLWIDRITTTACVQPPAPQGQAKRQSLVQFLRDVRHDHPRTERTPRPTSDGEGTVSLPFSRASVFLVPADANNELQPVRLLWSEGDAAGSLRSVTAGKYRIQGYRLERTDSSGTRWQVWGSGARGREVIVTEGKQTTIDLDPRVHVAPSARVRDSNLQLGLTVRGDSQMGVTVVRSNDRVPSQFTLLGPDGDQVAEGSLRYG